MLTFAIAKVPQSLDFKLKLKVLNISSCFPQVYLESHKYLKNIPGILTCHN